MGTVQDTITYTYGDTNRGDLLTAYDGTAISYDGIGNPLSDGTWSYAWQNGRELASMSNGSTIWNYTYDANGMRTKRTNGSTTYTYVYNGGQLSQMTYGITTMHFTYDADGRPTAVIHNGTVYYYVTNLQGDVVALLDSAGVQVVGYTYDAWGRLLSTTGSKASTLGLYNPLRYRSYVYDQETGLYYLQSRYYNPTIGRFLNADAFVATGQGLLGNNMFGYCRNNPIKNVDYLGCFGICVLDDSMNVNRAFMTPGMFGAGGGSVAGVNSSYYARQNVRAHDSWWRNSCYNPNMTWSNGAINQYAANVNSFDSFVKNPKSITGKTANDISEILGETWTQGTYGSKGHGWKFNNGDKMVAYHPGGGRHVGSYYILSSGPTGRIKIVGSDYVESPDDKATIIWDRQ